MSAAAFPGFLWVCRGYKILGVQGVFSLVLIGHTPKGACSSRGRSRRLLETAFSEPLLRTLLRNLFTVNP